MILPWVSGSGIRGRATGNRDKNEEEGPLRRYARGHDTSEWWSPHDIDAAATLMLCPLGLFSYKPDLSFLGKIRGPQKAEPN